jgi:cytochrome c oxidase assembly protein subunit 15
MLATSRSAKFFRLALYAAGLSLASLAFSAYARLSEAGLGCPEWPGCYGKLFAPLTAQDMDNGRSPDDLKAIEKKRAMQETGARFLSGALSLVLIRLFVLGFQLKKRKRSQQVVMPLVTLGVALGLSALGFATFEHRYKPLVQMMQLLGGLAVLLLLWWIALREQRLFRSATPGALTSHLRPRVLLAGMMTAGVVALGGWSMVNHAGLACPDFPTCQGSWWPPMDALDAFTLWRDAGLEYEGRQLNLPAATAVHMAHRVGAAAVLMYVGWLALYLLRVGFQDNLCRYGLLLLTVLLCAAALGTVEVLAHLPLAVAVAHNVMGVLLLLSLVTVYHVTRPPSNG